MVEAQFDELQRRNMGFAAVALLSRSQKGLVVRSSDHLETAGWHPELIDRKPTLGSVLLFRSKSSHISTPVAFALESPMQPISLAR